MNTKPQTFFDFVDRFLEDKTPIGELAGPRWKNDDVVSYENGNPHEFWEPGMGPKRD